MNYQIERIGYMKLFKYFLQVNIFMIVGLAALALAFSPIVITLFTNQKAFLLLYIPLLAMLFTIGEYYDEKDDYA